MDARDRFWLEQVMGWGCPFRQKDYMLDKWVCCAPTGKYETCSEKHCPKCSEFPEPYRGLYVRGQHHSIIFCPDCGQPYGVTPLFSFEKIGAGYSNEVYCPICRVTLIIDFIPPEDDEYALKVFSISKEDI